MNFILRILIIGISSYYFSSLFPWWIIILIPFILGSIIDDNYFSHFLSGFLGTSAAWLFILLNIDFETQSILTLKVIVIIILLLELVAYSTHQNVFLEIF